MEIFRYRIITNLQCNNRCSFCYQTFKPPKDSDVVLDITKMEETMKKVYKSKGLMERSTIMGGESLLLENICDYLKIAKNYSKKVCLVTNGKLITEELLIDLKNSGLDEIAISINSMTNFQNMEEKLKMSNYIIPNMRVNIPRCDESSSDKLRELLNKCLDNNFGCVICEDLMGRYGEPHYEIIKEWENIIEISNEHNFITYKDMGRNKIFGLFAHYSGYNETDFIITPLGNFCKWEKYCNKIDNYDLH